MRRTLVAVVLAVGLLAAGCSDDDGGNGNAEETPSASSSATSSSSPSATPSATPSDSAVTPDEFCTGIGKVLSADDADTARTEALELLSDGFPEDMSEEALDGMQVLVDISGSLGSTTQAFEAYRGLSSQERASVNALARYLLAECGIDLIKDLVPDLPSELPSWVPTELPSEWSSSWPTEIPSELRSLLPTS